MTILRTHQTHFHIDIHSEVIAGAASQLVQPKIILELTRFRSRMTEVIFIVWVCNGDVSYDEGSLQEVWTVTMTMTDVECLRLI